jgi:hypothetical protein
MVFSEKPVPTLSGSCASFKAHRFIVTKAARVLESRMARNQTSFACRRVVIDDRCRLPGRFFGRFATSATSELSRAA